MNWNLSERNSICTIPRPLRIAYLVDLKNISNDLIDKIFAESFSRWGGRRTLIVPVNQSGIDKKFEDWLFYNDPDIIYSYVDLSYEIQKYINEKFCPSFLQIHQPHGNPQSNTHYYKPKLYIQGLNCLSVLPSLKARKGLLSYTDNIKVIDADFSIGKNRFLEDNFGIIGNCESGTHIGNSNTDIFTPLTLITPEKLTSPRYHKVSTREYLDSEKQLFDKISSRQRDEIILSLASISDYLSHYLDFNSNELSDSFNLVVGSTPVDRIIYWNFYQHYSNVWPGDITTMCVEPSLFEDENYVNFIKEIINVRFRGSNSSKTVIIRSNSLKCINLESIAEKLQDKSYISYKCEVISDLSKISPNFEKKDRFYHKSNPDIKDSSIKSVGHFNGKDISVPVSQPFHIHEQEIPPTLRGGYWMIDAAIERVVDYCPYSNDRHIWKFPRRLRIDQVISRIDDGGDKMSYYFKQLRSSRAGYLSMFIDYLSKEPVLKMYEDVDLIRVALITEKYSLDGIEEAKYPQYRFDEVLLSDKGKYLNGVLHLFKSLHEAMDFLLHRFWNRVFNSLGSIPSHDREDIIDEIVKKHLKTPPTKKEDKERVAAFCLKKADEIVSQKHYIGWNRLVQMWNELFDKWIKNNPQYTTQEEDIKKLCEKHVEESTRLLCEYQVLFQGQEWTCSKCYHKNWISIDDLKSIVICEVCGKNESAFISKDWKFRANDFVTKALRYHGILPVIWCLKVLMEKKHNISSFYYAPSLKFFYDNKSYEKKTPNAEIDLVVIVDNKVYLCEAKTSKRIKDKELDKFAEIVNKIRPDVAVLAIMESKVASSHKTLLSKINPKIDSGIELEIIYLNSGDIDDSYQLPTGRSKKIRVF